VQHGEDAVAIQFDTIFLEPNEGSPRTDDGSLCSHIKIAHRRTVPYWTTPNTSLYIWISPGPNTHQIASQLGPGN
jgi:hypothetical protein